MPLVKATGVVFQFLVLVKIDGLHNTIKLEKKMSIGDINKYKKINVNGYTSFNYACACPNGVIGLDVDFPGKPIKFFKGRKHNVIMKGGLYAYPIYEFKWIPFGTPSTGETIPWEPPFPEVNPPSKVPEGIPPYGATVTFRGPRYTIRGEGAKSFSITCHPYPRQ